MDAPDTLAPGSPLKAAPEGPARDDAPVSSSDEKKKGKKRNRKDKRRDGVGSSRGVETVFRTSYRTHTELSALADAKANIMVSINGIIISIIIASFSPKIDANPELLIPTSVLLLGCLASLIYAVLAARPRVSGSVGLEDFRRDRANMLFFGHFVHLSEPEYVDGMTELLKDTDRLYHSMTKDLYGLGKVLEKKFALLRVSYTLFMFGLGAGVLLFIVVYVGIVVLAPAAGVAAGFPLAPRI